MKVLHVLDHSLPVMSGYSIRSRSIVTFQKALGLEPIVLTSPKHGPAPADREVMDGIPHYRTHLTGARQLPYARELVLMRRLARRITAVARAEHAAVIHAHSPVLNGLPALWAARTLGLPLVYEARGFWEDSAVDHGTTREGSFRYRVTRALETLVFKRASRVVVIAEAMRREIVARGVPAERISVVPNGVDVDRFRPVPKRTDLAAELGLGPGPTLGFIGSFYHFEGLRFLMQALPAVRRLVPGCQLLLVGAGEEEAGLRDLAASIGGAVLAGQVPHDRIIDFYSLIDVFVYPRRRMRLTELVTPLKPLEAMSMGRAVLASDVGGLLELVQHGVTGLIFRAESRGALVDEAARLAGDPALSASLGTAARRHVERERTWRRVVSTYLPVYGQLAPSSAGS